MTNMTNKRKIVRIGALALSIATPIALPATANEWRAWEGQAEFAPLAIYTDGSDTQAALLTCDAKGMLSAMISLQPASLPEQLAKNAPYSRSESATVMVGSASPVETTVRFIPAIDAIESRSHEVAAKVFNAAVLGEPLKMTIQRAGNVDTVLPEPNEVFKAFAKTCQNVRDARTKS